MEEEGVVLKIEPTCIYVLMKEKSHCAKCGVCIKDERKRFILRLNNSVRVKVGDKVKVSLEFKYILAASFIIYIVPLFGLLLGYFLGCGLTFLIKINYEQVIEVILSILGLIVAFIIIHQYDKRLFKKGKFTAKIVKVL